MMKRLRELMVLVVVASGMGCNTMRTFDPETGAVLSETQVFDADGFGSAVGALGGVLGPLAVQILENEAREAKSESEARSAVLRGIPVWSQAVVNQNAARIAQLQEQRAGLEEAFAAAGGSDAVLDALSGGS